MSCKIVVGPGTWNRSARAIFTVPPLCQLRPRVIFAFPFLNLMPPLLISSSQLLRQHLAQRITKNRKPMYAVKMTIGDSVAKRRASRWSSERNVHEKGRNWP